MFAIAFALTAALAYGVSDFYGAIAARRIGSVSSTFMAYSVATVVVALGLLLVPSTWTLQSALTGGLAGVFVAIGFLFFYQAMSSGPIAVLAPLIAVVYAAVPVAWAIVHGAVLSGLAWSGVGIGLLAVVALSVPAKGGAESDEERAADAASHKPQGLRLGSVVFGLLAALGMGGASIALDYAPKDSGISSAFWESAVAVLVLAIVFVFAPRPTKGELNYRALGMAAGSGVLMGIANSGFVLALQHGELALVGVLVALYPLATIVLARIVLKEHISRIQIAGIGAAIVAAVLMGLG